jgi:hypothetical protein
MVDIEVLVQAVEDEDKEVVSVVLDVRVLELLVQPGDGFLEKNMSAITAWSKLGQSYLIDSVV